MIFLQKHLHAYTVRDGKLTFHSYPSTCSYTLQIQNNLKLYERQSRLGLFNYILSFSPYIWLVLLAPSLLILVGLICCCCISKQWIKFYGLIIRNSRPNTCPNSWSLGTFVSLPWSTQQAKVVLKSLSCKIIVLIDFFSSNNKMFFLVVLADFLAGVYKIYIYI